MSDWKCPKCKCRTYARVDELKPDGRFGPGPDIRCVNCKRTFVAAWRADSSIAGASAETALAEASARIAELKATIAQATAAPDAVEAAIRAYNNYWVKNDFSVLDVNNAMSAALTAAGIKVAADAERLKEVERERDEARSIADQHLATIQDVLCRAEAAERALAAEKSETDRYRNVLYVVAGIVDPHYFGAGLTVLGTWLPEEIINLRNARKNGEHALAEAIEALKPFADAAGRWDETTGDDVRLWQNGERVDYLTVGDLRQAAAIRARSVLAGSAAEGGAIAPTVSQPPVSSGFCELRQANCLRNEEWIAGSAPLSLSFRGNELAGEVGEACNILKKLDRERLGLRGSRASPEQLSEELADVVICVDLIAMDLGINLWMAIVAKFNKTSEQRGLAVRIGEHGAEGGWQPIRNTPAVGGIYIVGGYVEDGVGPRHFERAWGFLVRTTIGPSWSIMEQGKQHVPIQYWVGLPPHPEHRPLLPLPADARGDHD